MRTISKLSYFHPEYSQSSGRQCILVFYPHNPFNPHHGSHLRCLQQLQDLSHLYDIILASTLKTSDSKWPVKDLKLLQVDQRNVVREIAIFEKSIAGTVEHYCGVALRAIKRLIPLFPSHRFSRLLHQLLLLTWFNGLAIRFQPCATIVHYTYWTYLSRVLAGGAKILELHDLLPINHHLTKKINKRLQGCSLLVAGQPMLPVGYVDYLSELPVDVIAEMVNLVRHINRFDLAWMISHRENRLLKDLGMIAETEVIYPLITSRAPCNTRNSPAILPVGPNAFNTYSLQNFIKDVVPLLDPQVSQSNEIQVTGRFLGDPPTPMPAPLKYYGVIDDYPERLFRSAFMIAPTSVGTGQQIKIFEALASGTPVIVYRCAVPADVLADNPSIIGVDTPREFAKAISQLWSDHQLLQRYWLLALEASEREAKRRSTFPYCRSVKKALAAYNCQKAGPTAGRVA